MKKTIPDVHGTHQWEVVKSLPKDSYDYIVFIGNHDWAYLTGTSTGKGISGHQNAHALEIKYLLKQNLDIIDLAFDCDGWVFSHAGFSKTGSRSH